MKKNTILALFCIGIVLSVQTLLPTLEYRNIDTSTGRNSISIPKASIIIIEDSSAFSEGTMENLTISDNEYLMLEGKLPFQSCWTNMTPSTAPGARYYPSMAYISKYNKVILFGGNDDTGIADHDDETWAYDLDINMWTNMTPPTKPSARWWHSMVYDSKHDKVILFGGDDVAGFFDDETWAYDFKTNNWTNMDPFNKPSARKVHSMVYDSEHDKVILFGGAAITGTDDETWVYDFQTNNWTNMDPSTKPSERYSHSMVYNSEHDKVILFGGFKGVSEFDDTWVYDLDTNTWTNMTLPTKPSARFDHAMVYDSEHDKVILFGGYDVDYDDETWAYDLYTNNWTNMDPSTKPSERYGASMAYDSKHDKVILFGGDDGSLNNQTWVFRLFDYQQTGKFDSKIHSLDGLHKFSVEISWSPENQTTGTNLTVQIGFSNTINDNDFTYTSAENCSFTFEGNARYFRYRVNFKSTDNLWYSPILENIVFVYNTDIVTTQNIVNIDESEGDTIVREDYLLEMILVSCLIGVGSVFAFITVLYKKKIDLLEKPSKLKGRDLKSKR